MEAEALKCPGCGLSRNDTMRKEAQGTYKSRALRCHACAERDRAQEEFTRQEHVSHGLMFSIEEGLDE
jgi:hypothetical protein